MYQLQRVLKIQHYALPMADSVKQCLIWGISYTCNVLSTLIIWQSSLEVNPGTLIGSFLVQILLYTL